VGSSMGSDDDEASFLPGAGLDLEDVKGSAREFKLHTKTGWKRCDHPMAMPFIFCVSLPNGKLRVFVSPCPMCLLSLLSLLASVVRAVQRGLRSEWCGMAGTLRQGAMLSSTLDRYPWCCSTLDPYPPTYVTSYLCPGERRRAAQGGTNEETPLEMRNVLMYAYVTRGALDMAVGLR